MFKLEKISTRNLFIIFFAIIAFVLIASGIRECCAAEHGSCSLVAKATKKNPAPEPKKVERADRPITASALPQHKEFQLAAIDIPVNVKVTGKIDERFVIATEAGEETQPEIRAGGLVEMHLVPGSMHFRE